MGQIEVERRHRDIALFDRLQIGFRLGRMLDLPERQPIIIEATRVDPLVELGPAIIAQALADHLDALDRIGRDRREIDVDQGARRPVARDQRRQHALCPALGGVERHVMAHALALVALAERDRGNAGEGAFHRRGGCARIEHVLTQIGAAIDARQDQIGRRILHDHRQRQDHRIGRRADHLMMVPVDAAQPDRMGEGERAALARLLLGRGDDGDVVGETPRDPLEQVDARRVDAVIVGDEDTHQTPGTSRVSPPV